MTDRPSLADALAAPISNRRPRCAVAVALEALSPEDADTLTEALASDLPSSGISRALRALGHPVPDFTLNRHRRKGCACESR